MSFSGDLYPTAGATSVLTTKGDMVDFDTQRQRFGIGSANQILQVKSNLPSWETVDLADTVLTTAGDVLYENNTPELARLPKGSDDDVLTLASGLPSWVAPSGGSTLTKVTKSYTDIDTGTATLPIYTLPADQALVNVYTDITTVFNLSTALTIGDSGDDNGFQEATDWTSGTGLTSATRGAYVTTFKTMRSTSGTTAISAYGFTVNASGGSTFSQLTSTGGRTIANGGTREELAQQFNVGHVLVGEKIISASWFIKLDQGSPTGNVEAFIRQADGTLIETSSTTLDASTVSSLTEYTFNFAGTYTLLADDMITISLDNGTGTSSNSLQVQTDDGSAMTNGTMYQAVTTGSSYAEISGEQMKMTVDYGTVTYATDTQGAVDFYLQIAS